MEEWVGRQWHRFIVQSAQRHHPEAAVSLASVQQAVAVLFRAAGGAPAVRLAPAGERAVGGPRSWLQKVAGSGTHAACPVLQPEVLALPAEVACFDDPALNRALYLWWAAQAAMLQPTGHWLSDQHHASLRVLQQWPGLRARHDALTRAHLAQRPAPHSLRGAAAQAEAAVQAVLRGGQPDPALRISPDAVAPVWLWLDLAGPAAEAARRPDPPQRPEASPVPTPADARRRRGQQVQDQRHQAPLMMMFRAESLLSWGEFIQVNRASDDEPGADPLAAANDLDTLALAPDGQACASRVRFDLDLPSAAADDQPLGPGQQLPEWDWRRGRLLPGHCAVQTYVNRAAPPFVPPPALRSTARQVRRRLELLRAAPRRARGQTEGDELDLDAWVRHRVAAACGQVSATPAVFCRPLRSERSLATLLLADLSLSTDAHATNTARVIDVIREALYVFGEALHASGDPVEMLGFSSVRRHQVRIQHLKGFDEAWRAPVQARIGAIKPGYYTRMGAAIRHATARLAARPERQRLLLLLTDGKPNDLDIYEGRYGLEDTRHAVQAARAAGLLPFCVTIDEAAHDYLPLLFGQQAYALVKRPQDLVQRLAAVYAGLTRG